MPVLSYLRDFAPRAQPAFVRRTYARELVGEVSFTFPMAMLEASFVAVVASLLFDVGPIGLATILAAPNFANFASPLWARLIHGRRKPAMLALIQGSILIVLLLIALLPTNPDSAAMLVVLVVIARCCYAGAMNTRTVIWRANYPRYCRSRVTGRLMLINTLLLATLPIVAAALLDRYQLQHPWLFRTLYLVSAAVGVGGVTAYLGLRVRRERLLQREELQHAEHTASDGSKRKRPSALHVLRTDKHFRHYMVWQFFAGLATMAGNTAMIAFIAEWVDGLPAGWRIDLPGPVDLGPYLVGALLGTAVVQLLVALSLPFFAHYLDKVHVTRFRTRHGTLWIVTQVTSFIVTALAATQHIAFGWLLLMLLVPRMSQGLVFGGGRLAWQLGHHDFADRHLAATYMAIHQTLTGVRGFIAPFLGVLLFTGWAQRDVAGLHLREWHGIGYWVFAITLVLAIIGWLGFVNLDKQVGGDGSAQKND